LRQFDAQPLNDDVALQRAIRPIAGATLTARSVTDAVRRVMAIDEVLEKDGR
jgi:Na+-translocating ferredoxin:NAD+ oxidoreductase RnfG subunit